MSSHIFKKQFRLLFCLLLVASITVSLEAQVTQYSGDEAGLKKLANELNGNRDLLMQLKPGATDVKLLTSSPESAKELQAYIDNLFSSIPAGGIAGKTGQTEVKIESASIADVKSGNDRSMPGGYTRTAGHYGDGFTIYAVSYVEPGEDLGMRFDAFVYLKDHWIVAPKMWRAFSQDKPPTSAEAQVPPKVDGMKMLRRRIGSWSEEITIKFSKTNRTVKVVRDLTVKPILGGKYLEMISSDKDFEARVHVFFEAKNGLILMNSMDTGGDTSIWRGKVAFENFISFVGDFTDGRKGTVSWDLTKTDEHRWSGVVLLANDEPFVEVSGIAKRK